MTKILLSIGEFFTLLGTILVLCEFFYLVALDNMTEQFKNILLKEPLKKTLKDRLCPWLVTKFQKGINLNDSDIEKEMKTRKNMLKWFYFAITSLFIGFIFKELGIWLY